MNIYWIYSVLIIGSLFINELPGTLCLIGLFLTDIFQEKKVTFNRIIV